MRCIPLKGQRIIKSEHQGKTSAHLCYGDRVVMRKFRRQKSGALRGRGGGDEPVEIAKRIALAIGQIPPRAASLCRADFGGQLDVQTRRQVFRDRIHLWRADIMRPIGIPLPLGGLFGADKFGKAGIPARNDARIDQGSEKGLKWLRECREKLCSMIKLPRISIARRHASTDTACLFEDGNLGSIAQ